LVGWYWRRQGVSSGHKSNWRDGALRMESSG
jgi:hypothetical protein